MTKSRTRTQVQRRPGACAMKSLGMHTVENDKKKCMPVEDSIYM